MFLLKRKSVTTVIFLAASVVPQSVSASETQNPVINAVDVSSKLRGNTLVFESTIDFTQSNKFRQIKSWRILMISNIATTEKNCNAKLALGYSGSSDSGYKSVTINGISYNAHRHYFFADTESETKTGNRLQRILKSTREFPLENIVGNVNQNITWCAMKMYPVEISLSDGYNSWTSIAVPRPESTGGIDSVCSFREGCDYNGWAMQEIINSRFQGADTGFTTDYANCKDRVTTPVGKWDSGPTSRIKDCVNNLSRLKPIEIATADIVKNSQDANKTSSDRKQLMLTESKSIIEEYRAMIKQLFQWSEEQGYVSLDGENLDVEKYAIWVQDMFLIPLEKTYNSENVEGFYGDRELIISNLEIRRKIFTKLKVIYDQIAASKNVTKANQSSMSKKTTITCVKGKITKKVTAVNPKCPVGYKKK